MMRRSKALKLDEIGYWTEIKLSILREYAHPYTKLVRASGLIPIYIDGFAGAGTHVLKGTNEQVPGSPVIALEVRPPFEEFHFVDLLAERADGLRRLTADNPKAHVHEGDSNQVLLTEVSPKVRYEQYRRGLCILDPYGLDLDWRVIKTAAEMESIEIVLNFPVMDMNMNVLWKNPDLVQPKQAQRMTAYWGDESWREAAYDSTHNLFKIPMKEGNEAVASAFQRRLKEAAGFSSVPEPLPMKNTKGAVVYYLFFAAQKPVAEKIVLDIFNKYRQIGSHHVS